jgi:hypothetical protein
VGSELVIITNSDKSYLVFFIDVVEHLNDSTFQGGEIEISAEGQPLQDYASRISFISRRPSASV